MQKILQERVLIRRKTEYDRLKEDREQRISEIIQSRKQERETKRKMIYFLRSEEERQTKLREEEELRMIQGISQVLWNENLIQDNCQVSSLVLSFSFYLVWHLQWIYFFANAQPFHPLHAMPDHVLFNEICIH